MRSLSGLCPRTARLGGSKRPPVPLKRLTVNVNRAVRRITFEGTPATGVRCCDMLDRVERTYKADVVVLCAGTIESAKIALLSGIPGPSNLVGRGITDHTIRYRHFTVPPADAEGTMTDSAKVVLQHPEASSAEHAFDIIVELGTELNQGRDASDNQGLSMDDLWRARLRRDCGENRDRARRRRDDLRAEVSQVSYSG
jgi:hypothetical protein